MWRQRLKYEGAEDFETRDPPFTVQDAADGFRRQSHKLTAEKYLTKEWEGDRGKTNTKGACRAQKTGNVVSRSLFFQNLHQLKEAMALTATPPVSIFATLFAYNSLNYLINLHFSDHRQHHLRRVLRRREQSRAAAADRSRGPSRNQAQEDEAHRTVVNTTDYRVW